MGWLTELLRSRLIRGMLILAVATAVGSAVWINRQYSEAAIANSTGYGTDEHRLFRAMRPISPPPPRAERDMLVEAVPGAATTSENLSAPRIEAPIFDWPAMLGPLPNARCPSENVKTQWPTTGPKERWRIEIGRGYSAPVIRKGRLIVFHRQGDEEVVEAFDAATGQSLWNYRYGTTYKCGAHFSDGPYSTPATDNERVFAWGAQGVLRCLSLADGKLLWERATSKDFEAVENQFPVASSPLIEGDKVILNVGGKPQQAGVVALDAKTGETLWKSTEELASYATPTAATICGRRYVFVFTQQGLVALNPDDGQVFWRVDYRSMNKELVNSTSPMVVDNLIVLSGWSLGALCIEVLPDGKYKERWRDRRGLDSQYANLVTDGTYVYGCAARDSTYRCVDLKTGKVRWAWSSDIIGRGAYSIVVGKRVILFGEPGRLVSLELGGDEPVLNSITDEGLLAAPCYTMPAMANGLLYLRNETNVSCIDLTPDG